MLNKYVLVFLLFFGVPLIHAEPFSRKYKIPEKFKTLIDRQVFDIDFIFINEAFGSGQISERQDQYTFNQVKIHKPLLKRDTRGWVLDQLKQGVPKKGVFCIESLVRQFGCIEGNLLLRLNFIPEKLVVHFEIAPVLLETNEKVEHRYLADSSVQKTTMVVDYAFNQSLAANNRHAMLRFGGTLAAGEKHLRTSFRNLYNQNASVTKQYGELREFYFRNDLRGRYLTLGLQEQWSFYHQTAAGRIFHPREDTIALSWGNSANTDNNSKLSALFPVQVFMPEAGRAEVFLNGALLATEMVGAGITVLKTDYWPQGVYDVEIKTYVSGRLQDVQRQMVFKDGSGYSGKAFDLWLGTSAPDRRRIYGDEDRTRQCHEGYQALMGGSFSYPVTEGISVNSALHWSKAGSAVELGTRLFLFGRFPFSANVIFTEQLSRGGVVRLSGSVARTSFSGSYEYFDVRSDADKHRFSGDRNRFTGNMMFSPARGQHLVFSLRRDFYLGTFSEAIDYRRRWVFRQNTELESQISVQHSNRFREKYGSNDLLASSGFSINLVLTLFFDTHNRQSQNRVALEYRNIHDQHLVINGNHQRYFDEGLVQGVALSGKMTRKQQDLWGVASFKSSVLGGSAGGALYTGEQANNWGIFSNLYGQIGITPDALVMGEGQSSSAALLKVPDSGKGLLTARVNGRFYPLDKTKTLVALQPYRTHRLNITSNNESEQNNILQLNRDSFLGTLYPGNIITFDIDAWYAVDVLGWITDGAGRPVSGLILENSRSQALTNLAGLFSMTFDRTSLTMTGYKNGKRCEMNISNTIKQQGKLPFYRLKNIPCHLH